MALSFPESSPLPHLASRKPEAARIGSLFVFEIWVGRRGALPYMRGSPVAPLGRDMQEQNCLHFSVLVLRIGSVPQQPLFSCELKQDVPETQGRESVAT